MKPGLSALTESDNMIHDLGNMRTNSLQKELTSIRQNSANSCLLRDQWPPGLCFRQPSGGYSKNQAFRPSLLEELLQIFDVGRAHAHAIRAMVLYTNGRDGVLEGSAAAAILSSG